MTSLGFPQCVFYPTQKERKTSYYILLQIHRLERWPSHYFPLGLPWISPKKASTWFWVSAMNNSIFYPKFFHVPSFQIPSFRKMTIFQATKRRTRKPNSFRLWGTPYIWPLFLGTYLLIFPQVERVENRLRKQMANSQVNWAPRNLGTAQSRVGTCAAQRRCWGFQTPRWRLRRENRNSSGWIPQPQKLRGFLYFFWKR